MLKTAKTGAFLLLFGLVLNCQTYNNFRAYYNTYYNAKQSFRTGVEKVRDQPTEIDPDQFISIYPGTQPGGRQDFEKAIDNAAQILQRFPTSKWVDGALLLIGKSYYYLHDYYSALQKFEAVLGLKQQSELKHQAVIWKSSVLFQLASHQEAVRFLQDQLTKHKSDWRRGQKAIVKVNLASHLAMTGRYNQAAETLQSFIPYLKEGNLRGRSYFLLGQLFMRLENYTKAYQAFYSAAGFNLGFEVVYHSKLKAAWAATLARQEALANSIYEEMLSDDKNFTRRYAIMYELGHAAEQRGDYSHAARIYKQVLANAPADQLSGLSTDIYFRLAQIYSRQFKNYELAKAYFDSSSAARQKTIDEKTANTYGQYISLKAQIAKIDSLFWLASLKPLELDSVLAVIKSRRRDKPNRETTAERLVLTNTQINEGQTTEASYSAAYGFLNYKNERMSARGISEFRAAWGNRPLTDNWRRIEAVASTNVANQENGSQRDSGTPVSNITITEKEPASIFDEIPFSQQEKKQKLQQKRALQYRLGNLFFLTLNKPDSAITYYKKVITGANDSDLTPKAMYSLFQLYLLEGDSDRADYYKNIILENYGSTIYASRLRGETTPDSTASIRSAFYSLLTDSSLTNRQRAPKLEKLASENLKSPLAAQLFFNAIKAYIQVAQTAVDSTKTVDENPYSGRYWEKVRAMIEKHLTLFPKAPNGDQVKIWQRMLASEAALMTCKVLNITPKVIGGMPAFLAKINFPPELKGVNVSGTLTYQILIGKKGKVKSFELTSNPTGLGIEEAYNKAITKFLRFEPVLYKGKPVQISCSVAFPIKK